VFEDKVHVLEHSHEDKEKQIKNFECNMQVLWDNNNRTKLQVMGVEEGEECKIKIYKTYSKK
jgi:hypothetical protein